MNSNNFSCAHWPNWSQALTAIALVILASVAIADAEAGDSHERLREKVNAMLQDFLSPPLYASSWSRGFGTLYTALYRPLNGSLELCWPDTRLSFSTSEFVESDHELYFGDERRQRAAV